MTRVICALTWCRYNRNGTCTRDSIYLRLEKEYGIIECADFAVKEELVGRDWLRKLRR